MKNAGTCVERPGSGENFRYRGGRKKKRNLIMRMLDRIRKLFNAGEPSERVEIPSADKVEAETQKEHTDSGAETPEGTAPTASGEYDLDQIAQQEKPEESELAPVAGNEASEYALDEDVEAQAAPILRWSM